VLLLLLFVGQVGRFGPPHTWLLLLFLIEANANCPRTTGLGSSQEDDSSILSDLSTAT